MVTREKKGKREKGEFTELRVSMPKSTYRALKVKCALRDITVTSAIRGLVEKLVKDVEMDKLDTKANK
ncbi:hypothetical protein ES703_109825 [subsurface metagenome]